MSSDSLKDGILGEFGDALPPDSKLLEECISMCQIYNLEPTDLRYKWEAIIYRPSVHSEITSFDMDSLTSLKAQLQRELAKKNTSMKPKPKPAVAIDRRRIPAFAERNMNKGQGVGLVKIEPQAGSSSAGASSVMFVGPKMDPVSRKARNYRYMYEKPSGRSEVLDDRIDEFAELIREHHKGLEFGDPSASTDEEVFIVGRITSDLDSLATSSKLTEATLCIESSRMLASGTRTPLRFDLAFEYEGKNSGGGRFLVTEMLTLPTLSQSPISSGLPNAKMDSTTGDPFSMAIATGPYTVDTDLAFQPWRAFLKGIRESKPNVILLMGPFVDAEHPKIQSGDTDSTPAHLFQKVFIETIRSFLDSSPGSIALLIPSIRDIRIYLLPNPAQFSINNVAFAATSIDVLFHLRKEEYIKRGTAVDPLPRHPMTRARTRWPIRAGIYCSSAVPFELSAEVNLDITHSSLLKLGEGSDGCAPDVLILPSRLKYFSKTVYGTAAINPSLLSKGMYSMLNFSGHGTGGLKERIKTEFIKLES
ncbi:hypothetical protein BD779DRAFT_1668572 [Infundibulicybe gibba]|nr:hypothetical protein BD779DRAFT_1668572 [Infundibulicybe gibba]